ncbi:MAG: thioesterase family protein [Planctomycetota bacterium]
MPADSSNNLPGFPAVFKLPVQWGDQDLFGHVNNIVYFRWFESARVVYWVDSGLREALEPAGLGPILAHTSCDYKKQIKYPDTIEVGARVAKIGVSSVTLEHYVYSHQNQAVSATGKSIVVLFDYQSQNPIPIDDRFRKMFDDFEAGV